MGVTYGNKSIKVYTKTKHHKSGNTYNAKMYWVIDGTLHMMLKYFPKEFQFIIHESKRSLSAPKK